MSNDAIWEKFLTRIKSKVSLMSFNYIFKDLRLYSYENSKITIVIPSNELLLQNINKNYNDIIEEILNDITNDTCEIKYVFDKDIDKILLDNKIVNIDEIETKKEKNDLDKYNYSSNFNPKYTFDTFIVGESNKLAYGTALSVAKNPGKLYNPYFIYAKSGLGKTHLMHAIGNYIVSHSDKKVLYITAEQFTIDYRSILNYKNKNDNNFSYLEAFREKYRNVDVLMIDDIQFLENMPKSQVEFTNTFNSLYENEKQIIIASDTSINDYKKIEERLKTRFRWGLTESINPPEIELKKNIIRNKIKINNYDLDISDNVVDYIANNCGSDIRNLEGAVVRIIAYKATFNIPVVTLEIAQEALKEFVPTVVYSTNSVTKIIEIVAKYFNLDSAMLKGKMKKKNVTDARAIAMYLSRNMTDESLERIGLEFGGRDHSTVIYSYEKISNELKTNIQLQQEIKKLKDKICE
ncbi:MAG: chromosomal replication initiator protein DnaA [Bacilli bacterium]|nr:chromosomal replication initiator protein DnaA [Bacilli bacterium]